MRIFLRNLCLFAGILFIINLFFGRILLLKKEIMIEKKMFFSAITLNEFYQTTDSIQIVFIGSSRCYSSFDADLISNLTHFDSYNLGTSAQSPITSYFVLNELFKYQKPETIFLELSAEVLTNNDQLINGGYVFDHLRFSKNKIKFFFEGFSWKERIMMLFPMFRFRGNLGYLVKRIFSNPEILSDGDTYITKGFVCNKNRINSENLIRLLRNTKWDFEQVDLSKRNIEYINKISELCYEKKVQLFLIISPYPKFVLNNFKNINIFRKSLYDIGQRNGRKLLDFSDCTSFLDDTLHFKNSNHLNCQGAYLFSTCLSKMLLNQSNQLNSNSSLSSFSNSIKIGIK
jgi:hypothetical protein